MTEQHYRIIKDRDKGDDPQWEEVREGDRKTVLVSLGREHLVRIERPVPTTDEPKHPGVIEYERIMLGQHPSVPTREQIAEAIDEVQRGMERDELTCISTYEVLDRLRVALTQKGIDR